eukprot:1916554-Pleurochrysis_carterae.AAC.1
MLEEHFVHSLSYGWCCPVRQRHDNGRRARLTMMHAEVTAHALHDRTTRPALKVFLSRNAICVRALMD